jgi:hypothetical protein
MGDPRYPNDYDRFLRYALNEGAARPVNTAARPAGLVAADKRMGDYVQEMLELGRKQLGQASKFVHGIVAIENDRNQLGPAAAPLAKVAEVEPPRPGFRAGPFDPKPVV